MFDIKTSIARFIEEAGKLSLEKDQDSLQKARLGRLAHALERDLAPEIEKKSLSVVVDPQKTRVQIFQASASGTAKKLFEMSLSGPGRVKVSSLWHARETVVALPLLDFDPESHETPAQARAHFADRLEAARRQVQRYDRTIYFHQKAEERASLFYGVWEGNALDRRSSNYDAAMGLQYRVYLKNLKGIEGLELRIRESKEAKVALLKAGESSFRFKKRLRRLNEEISTAKTELKNQEREVEKFLAERKELRQILDRYRKFYGQYSRLLNLGSPVAKFYETPRLSWEQQRSLEKFFQIIREARDSTSSNPRNPLSDEYRKNLERQRAVFLAKTKPESHRSAEADYLRERQVCDRLAKATEKDFKQVPLRQRESCAVETILLEETTAKMQVRGRPARVEDFSKSRAYYYLGKSVAQSLEGLDNPQLQHQVDAQWMKLLRRSGILTRLHAKSQGLAGYFDPNLALLGLYGDSLQVSQTYRHERGHLLMYALYGGRSLEYQGLHHAEKLSGLTSPSVAWEEGFANFVSMLGIYQKRGEVEYFTPQTLSLSWTSWREKSRDERLANEHIVGAALRDLVHGLPEHNLTEAQMSENLTRIFATMQRAGERRPLKMQEDFHQFVQDYLFFYPEEKGRVAEILEEYGYADLLQS